MNKWLFWLLRLVSWDAVLPILVVCTPKIVGQLAPPPPKGGPMVVLEISSLAVAMAAFAVRAIMGGREIRRYGYPWQRVPLMIGLLLLALADTAFILIQGNPAVPDDPVAVCAPLLVVYFCLMAVALLPLRSGTMPQGR